MRWGSVPSPRSSTARLCAGAIAAGLLAVVAAPVASAHTGELKTRRRGSLPPGGGGDPGRRRQPGMRSRFELRSPTAKQGRRSGRPGSRSSSASRPVQFEARTETTGVAGCLLPARPDRRPEQWRALRFSIEVAGPARHRVGPYVPPSLFRQWLFEPWVLLAAGGGGCAVPAGIRPAATPRAERPRAWARLVLFGLGLALTGVAARVAARCRRRPLPALGAHAAARPDRRRGARAAAARGARAAGPSSSSRPRCCAAGRAPLLPAPRRGCCGRRSRSRSGRWCTASGTYRRCTTRARNQTVHDLEHASFVSPGCSSGAI